MAEGGIGGLLGSAGGSAEQLFVWQVLGSIVSAMMAPVQQGLQQHALGLDPNTPLDPNVAAAMVVQQILDASDGAQEAKLSGINGDRFSDLVTQAGNAADFGAVVAAFQRGLIHVGDYDPTDVSLAGALASGQVRKDWLPIIEKLTVAIPTVAEVMNAWLEGQIGEDEARKRYNDAGGDPTWFQTSYNANGQAPTPVQALELLNRGIIPLDGVGPDKTSYQQAFLEGPWRNKWLQSFIALREYLPPPRTVTAMYHDGQLSHDKAADLLTKQGLAPDLVTDYLSKPVKASTTAEKHLAKGDILSLFNDGLMSRSAAIDALVALKYSHSDAELLISLETFKAETAKLKSGVGQVRTLFQAGKVSRADATAMLATLDVTPAQAKTLLDTWEVTVTQAVRTLDAAQIVGAWHIDLYDTPTAIKMLGILGYDSEDATVLLAIKNKGKLSPEQLAQFADTPTITLPTIAGTT
jgi:hypothetical protein